MAVRLLALDLDGTLYRSDGSISQWDIEAVERAKAAGVTVTIATGRIATGTLPAAKVLGLTTTLVCAEGAVLVDPRTEETISHRAMPEHHVARFTRTAGRHGLASFWFMRDEIHGEEHGRAHVGYVSTWSPAVTLHGALPECPAWERRHEVTMTVAIGTHDAVKAALERLEDEHGGELLTVRFPIDMARKTWTVLARDAKVDKATGLDEVARGLGITAQEVAVVGDWVNDVPMFRWAGRSFVMGQSPEHVAAEASDRLKATSATGGGVAEAVMKILRERL